jgi:hypothetical protein
MATYCPSCKLSRLAYCRECARSYNFGTTYVCLFKPEHIENPERKLHCSSCGAEATKLGVIVGGVLIMFDFVKRSRGLKTN